MARRRRRNRRILASVVVLACLGVAAWYLWPRASGSPETEPDGAGRVSVIDESVVPPSRAEPADSAGEDAPDAPAPKPTPGETPDEPGPRGPAVTTFDAEAALRRGLELRDAGKLIEARRLLSRAALAATLPSGQAAEARQAAQEVARDTLFSPEALPDDPYCEYYNVRFGDNLLKIIQDHDLRVPYRLLMEINGITDETQVRAGNRIKLIRGPFHARLDKSEYAMDVYLQRGDLSAVFIQRLPVGLGKNGSTPVGRWRVRQGSKYAKATWYPPPNSPQRGIVRFGEDGYPLGPHGYWIGLEGIGPNTRGLTGYGLHGTHEPESIGRSESLGCIRLGDEDIARAYLLLQETHSTATVQP